MFQKYSSKVIYEISQVMAKVKEDEVRGFIDLIVNAKTIVTCGAGRMGMMAKAFAMRLSHLDYNAFNLGDSNVPRIGHDDLLVVCSGSGETKTIVELARIAKYHEAKIGLITSRKMSSIEKLSDRKVVLPSCSKVIDDDGAVTTIQPMTSLTEQCSLIFLDAIVLMMIELCDHSAEKMKHNHSILE